MDYQATQNRVGLVRRLRRWANGLGHTHKCCVCGRQFFRFSKFRGGWAAFSPYLHEMQWTGSDFDNFWCPFCRSHDRERHLLLFLDRLGLWKEMQGKAVLHLAPEKWLIHKIESMSPSLYAKGDLFPSREGVQKIDVTSIPYADETFDFAFCNHVLEHVPDDRKAMSELWRVLKHGGIAILQTPFAANLAVTRENEPDILADPAKRIATYGQEDHVRLYGTDLFDRFRAAGFTVELKKHADVLPDIPASFYGVNPSEPLFLCRK